VPKPRKDEKGNEEDSLTCLVKYKYLAERVLQVLKELLYEQHLLEGVVADVHGAVVSDPFI